MRAVCSRTPDRLHCNLSRKLRLLPDAACPSLVLCEITLAIGTETAHIAVRDIKRRILFEQLEIPLPKIGNRRHRGRAHGLVPVFFHITKLDLHIC
ncbi:hypothetical protein BMS3Abin16_01553 [archaeon BMS3Abin16]|nr:hypothetical protein BMS3Abin16_01553 [archaeon BMS3Abin16]